jgi:MFS family permease
VLNLSAFVVIPPISGLLMERYGAIATYGLTIPLLLIAMVLTAFMPGKTSTQPIGEDTADYILFEEHSSGLGVSRKLCNFVTEWAKRAQSHLQADVLPMLKSTVIIRGLIGMITVSFGESISIILMQYLHVRFKWRYEEVG